ncbi:MAG: hypothetical protein OEW17_03725 [Gemmatimonadota bacterium]|nr:hypothetical protein [Gemmatimonadota bacterium]MDH4347891.1 hypothetical protein [Gemmatimonadota bacterium]MDH5282423.1 hypothetical protein [Gemmatimonadota bacterium]
MPRCVTFLLFTACLLARPLAGQTQVSGVRDLSFGIVIAGVPATVAPGDPVKSGQFYLRYVTGGRARVRLTLPATLNRVGGGGTMPISFRNGDAFVLGTAPGSVPSSFNPGGLLNYRFTGSADANIYLGGRVTPAAATASGNYTAPVVLTATFF